MITRRKLIDATREYIGTPFHHAARVKGTGVDCMGLLVCVGRDINYPLQDIATYSRTATGFSLVERCANFLDEIQVGSEQPGDIGLFWVDESTEAPQHACIFSDYRDKVGMIHAWESAGRVGTNRRGTAKGEFGSVVEHEFSKFWKTRLCRVFTMRGVDPWQP